MTPEERAVVQAAMREHRGCAPETCGGSRLDPCRLANAIEALTFSCSDCNAGGHTCPGDGEPIGHGDTDCGKHDEPAADEPGWVPRTWADVRQGDRVRLNEATPPAYVQSAVHLHWHTDPRTGTSYHNPPQPMEWSAVRVTLAQQEDPLNHDLDRVLGEFDMDPAKLIEIELSPSEVAAIKAIGWEHRIGLVVTAEPKH